MGTRDPRVPCRSPGATVKRACRPWYSVNLKSVSSSGPTRTSSAERQALADAGIDDTDTLEPKRHTGNLFAAAAALQVGLAAARPGKVLANCFGYGAEQAAFVLEPA